MKVEITDAGLLILKPDKNSMRSFTRDEASICRRALEKYWKDCEEIPDIIDKALAKPCDTFICYTVKLNGITL